MKIEHRSFLHNTIREGASGRHHDFSHQCQSPVYDGDVSAMKTPVSNLEKRHSDRDASRTFMPLRTKTFLQTLYLTSSGSNGTANGQTVFLEDIRGPASCNSNLCAVVLV